MNTVQLECYMAVAENLSFARSSTIPRCTLILKWCLSRLCAIFCRRKL